MHHSSGQFTPSRSRDGSIEARAGVRGVYGAQFTLRRVRATAPLKPPVRTAGRGTATSTPSRSRDGSIEAKCRQRWAAPRSTTPSRSRDGSIEARSARTNHTARGPLRRVRATAPLKPTSTSRRWSSCFHTPSRSRDGSIEATGTWWARAVASTLRRVRATAPLKLAVALMLRLAPRKHSVAFARRLH